MTILTHDPLVTPSRDRFTTISLWTIGVMATVASFATLRDLAGRCGWPPVTAWLFPLIVDLLALTSWREWRRRNEGPSRRFASRCGWAATAVSVTCNAVEHLAAWDAHGGSLRWSFFVAAVGAVPPLVVPLIVRLTDGRETVAEPVMTPAWYRFRPSRARHAAPTPVLAPAPLVAPAMGMGSAVVEHPVSKAARVAEVVAAARRDGVVAILKLRERYGCSHGIAKAANEILRGEGVTA